MHAAAVASIRVRGDMGEYSKARCATPGAGF